MVPYVLALSWSALCQVLSANPEAPLNIECLMEDTDVKGYMSRDAYQVMMEPLLQKLEDVCLEALKGAGLKDGSEITNVRILPCLWNQPRAFDGWTRH